MAHHNLQLKIPESGGHWMGILDTDAFVEALQARPHVTVLFYGHTHVWSTSKLDDLQLNNLPAVSYVFGASQVALLERQLKEAEGAEKKAIICCHRKKVGFSLSHEQGSCYLRGMKLFLPMCLLLLAKVGFSAEPGEWKKEFPRAEIAPIFEKTDDQNLKLTADKVGTNGQWNRLFPVEGGKNYRFQATRMAENVEHPRRSCVVRIEWRGAKGQTVKSPHKVNPEYFGEEIVSAGAEFPPDKEANKDGSVLVEDTYLAPDDATEAVVQLELRWTEAGSVSWNDVSFAEAPPLKPRLVKLAAVHSKLASNNAEKSPALNRELLVPLIEKAAAQDADLIVLGELLTCINVTQDYASVAEPVPGPTTDFFGKLAKKHDCYIVAGLPERDGNEVFNVAVMMGPDGKVAGKYRKVSLPDGEIKRGISPGRDYPVFETRFGKVGLMVCFDVFFPEVARELSLNGAEVIALPIWGGNPKLAAARCAENGVYLVSSTYTNQDHDWMKTAIWDREGKRIAEATEWGQVVIAEVDLNKATYWAGLGDFQSRIKRMSPVRVAE